MSSVLISSSMFSKIRLSGKKDGDEGVVRDGEDMVDPTREEESKMGEEHTVEGTLSESLVPCMDAERGRWTVVESRECLRARGFLVPLMLPVLPGVESEGMVLRRGGEEAEEEDFLSSSMARTSSECSGSMAHRLVPDSLWKREKHFFIERLCRIQFCSPGVQGRRWKERE